MENQYVRSEEVEEGRAQQAIYGIPERDFLAWKAQRDAAKGRGIAFRFTLVGWWLWWKAELRRLGPDAVRGRKRGQYVMARNGDQGAYEDGNVRAATPAENGAEAVPTMRVAASRSWARRKAAGIKCHLAVRGDGHPRSTAVVTPLGRFGSVALASEAHGFTRQRGGQLARAGAAGWRYE